MDLQPLIHNLMNWNYEERYLSVLQMLDGLPVVSQPVATLVPSSPRKSGLSFGSSASNPYLRTGPRCIGIALLRTPECWHY